MSLRVCVVGMLFEMAAISGLGRVALAEEEPGAPRLSCETVEPFGREGQFVLQSGFGASFDHGEGPNASGSMLAQTGVSVSPNIDWFVKDGLSLGAGATVSVSYRKFGSIDETTLTVGGNLAVGYAIPFSPWWSFWPRLLPSLSHNTTSGSAAGTAAGDRTEVYLRLEAPVLFHATSHFFLGMGPFAIVKIHATNEQLAAYIYDYNVGLTASIGVWF
jgi:hypothetical protein